MKLVGNVEVPQTAFLAALKSDERVSAQLQTAERRAPAVPVVVAR